MERVNMIVGIVKNNGTLLMKKFEETNDWTSNIRHVGMKKTSTQENFRINATQTLKDLRGRQDNEFSEKDINACQKFTKMEHMNKIVFT